MDPDNTQAQDPSSYGSDDYKDDPNNPALADVEHERFLNDDGDDPAETLGVDSEELGEELKKTAVDGGDEEADDDSREDIEDRDEDPESEVDDTHSKVTFSTNDAWGELLHSTRRLINRQDIKKYS